MGTPKNRNLITINQLLSKVVDGNNLSAKEAEETFKKIFLYDSEGFHYAIFIAAIHAKGETTDELLGLYRANDELGTKLKPKIPLNKTTDLSGSGGGDFKTFNVSTTASFIVAAAGYTVAKQAFWGVTSPTGSADIFAAFGVDIAKLSVKQVEKALEQTRICPIYYPYFSPKLENRGKVARKIYIDKGIKIKTPLHLVSNLYAPFPIKRRIYGLYSEKYLRTVGELFSKLGYEKTLTFYGLGGMPEISNFGETIIVEQQGKNLKRYTINPSDLGVKKVKQKQVKTGDRDQNIIDFLQILLGKKKGAKCDLVAINAAAALYVMGETSSIKKSVPRAQEIIKSGNGFKVLEKLVNTQGNPRLLKRWLTKI